MSNAVAVVVVNQNALRNYHSQVDAIFDAKRLYLRSTEFEIASGDFLTCVKAGFSVMTRKDSRLIDWWNPAFAKLVADTSQWTAICNDLTDEHGEDEYKFFDIYKKKKKKKNFFFGGGVNFNIKKFNTRLNIIYLGHHQLFAFISLLSGHVGGGDATSCVGI